MFETKRKTIASPEARHSAWEKWVKSLMERECSFPVFGKASREGQIEGEKDWKSTRESYDTHTVYSTSINYKGECHTRFDSAKFT